jgi:hypothetical protein
MSTAKLNREAQSAVAIDLFQTSNRAEGCL